MKLFSKNSNLCDHNPPTLQTDGRTDRQTTCDRNTALCTKVHRAVKTKHFRWWNVFDDTRRMGRWSFWSWFDVIDLLLTKICAKKWFFLFSFAMTLIFRQWSFKPQICSHSYSCPALCFRYIRSFFTAFTVTRKSEARDRRTDRQRDGVERLIMRPIGKDRIINLVIAERELFSNDGRVRLQFYTGYDSDTYNSITTCRDKL